jgi:hypothetical protein
MNLRKLITIILQVLFAILLLIFLIVNTIVDVYRSKLIHTMTTMENVQELVPPAFSLCSDDIDFRFDCHNYGETSANCPNLVKAVNVSNDETFGSWFTSCNVFQTTQPMLFSTPKNPPKDWSSHHSPLFIKYLFRNASSSTRSSKIFFMLWNPYDLPPSDNATLSIETTPQILNPYRLTQMDATRERVFSFRWRKYIFLNGTEKFDLDHQLELDSSTNSSKTPLGLVHFKPASFNMEITREHLCFPTFSVFTMFMVLLAVLIIYSGLFNGKGKYKTWGFAHMIAGYYPQQHILPMENNHHDNNKASKPTADDVLRVYLDGLDRAEFEKK